MAVEREKRGGREALEGDGRDVGSGGGKEVGRLLALGYKE